MLRVIQTKWVENPTPRHQWAKAQVYKTKGGKLACRIMTGYGTLQHTGGTEPRLVASNEPRYFSTAMGVYKRLQQNGLGDAGITLQNSRWVWNPELSRD